MTTIFDEIMKDIAKVEGTQVIEKATATLKNDDKSKRKERYNKTRDKTLLQKKIKYQEDKKKLIKIRNTLEKAFKEIPDSELLLLTNKRVIISKNKQYKLVYKILRK